MTMERFRGAAAGKATEVSAYPAGAIVVSSVTRRLIGPPPVWLARVRPRASSPGAGHTAVVSYGPIVPKPAPTGQWLWPPSPIAGPFHSRCAPASPRQAGAQQIPKISGVQGRA